LVIYQELLHDARSTKYKTNCSLLMLQGCHSNDCHWLVQCFNTLHNANLLEQLVSKW